MYANIFFDDMIKFKIHKMCKNVLIYNIIENKKRYENEIGIMCDVALDPYTSHGHDGLIKSNTILNLSLIHI